MFPICNRWRWGDAFNLTYRTLLSLRLPPTNSMLLRDLVFYASLENCTMKGMSTTAASEHSHRLRISTYRTRGRLVIFFYGIPSGMKPQIHLLVLHSLVSTDEYDFDITSSWSTLLLVCLPLDIQRTCVWVRLFLMLFTALRRSFDASGAPVLSNCVSNVLQRLQR